jgi:hypothetical protein
MIHALLLSIKAAAEAYSAWVNMQRENEIDKIEDEIDRLAAIGNAASKLRMERLSQRLRRKREQISSL